MDIYQFFNVKIAFMNRISGVFQTILIVILSLSFTSCKKIIDKYFPGHGGDNTEKNYRIKKLVFTYRAATDGNKQTGIVYYNQHNNPDSVIFDGKLFPPTEGDPSMAKAFYLNYNDKNQLISTTFVGMFSSYHETHKYIYDDKGRVFADSLRTLEADPVGAVSYPEYDNQGRVIKEVFKIYESGGYIHPTPIVDSMDYKYDSAGNLKRAISPYAGIPEYVQYDNKISYLRTNDIWMFISRNYSRNNPNRVTEYNEVNLPLGFRNGVVISFLGYGDPYEIEYEKVN
jgi:hypothetical protein